MNTTPFKINFNNERDIYGEFMGNTKSNKAIIYSHGFGVKRDNKGIFYDISQILKDEYLHILFDYAIVQQDGYTMAIPSYDKSAEILTKVVKWAKDTFDITELNIVAHSAGCFIPCIADLKNVNKTIFMATPPKNAGYELLIKDLEERGNTRVNVNGVTIQTKSDGTKRYLFPEFWEYFKKIKDPTVLYKKYIKNNDSYSINGLDDFVFKELNIQSLKELKGLKYTEIPGNHDFDGRTRVVLLSRVIEIL